MSIFKAGFAVLGIALYIALGITTHAYALEPGDPAPEFTLPLLFAPTTAPPPDERRTALVKLSDYRGKVVWVDFWQSNCAPCRDAVPLLNAMHDEFAGQDVAVLAISTDFHPTDTLSFMRKYPINYPVASDPTARVAGQFGLKGVPTGYLIARDGTIHTVLEGSAHQKLEKIRAQLLALSSVSTKKGQ